MSKQSNKINHPAVDNVEDAGMDEGRFFVHLKKGYSWAKDDIQHSKSFGSVEDAVVALNIIYEVRR